MLAVGLAKPVIPHMRNTNLSTSIGKVSDEPGGTFLCWGGLCVCCFSVLCSLLQFFSLLYWNLMNFLLQIQFREKVLWTAITLFIFLVCCQVGEHCIIV